MSTTLRLPGRPAPDSLFGLLIAQTPEPHRPRSGQGYGVIRAAWIGRAARLALASAASPMRGATGSGGSACAMSPSRHGREKPNAPAALRGSAPRHCTVRTGANTVPAVPEPAAGPGARQGVRDVVRKAADDPARLSCVMRVSAHPADLDGEGGCPGRTPRWPLRGDHVRLETRLAPAACGNCRGAKVMAREPAGPRLPRTGRRRRFRHPRAPLSRRLRKRRSAIRHAPRRPWPRKGRSGDRSARGTWPIVSACTGRTVGLAAFPVRRPPAVISGDAGPHEGLPCLPPPGRRRIRFARRRMTISGVATAFKAIATAPAPLCQHCRGPSAAARAR